MVDEDPVVTNPDHYAVLWENDRVRVLEYFDTPGAATTPHVHPDSVLVALTSFRRRLFLNDEHVDVELAAGRAVWLPAQRHAGLNIGDSDTRTILIELKGESGAVESADLGPDLG
jgi:quercetin dioxygenase-like cupin family protein